MLVRLDVGDKYVESTKLVSLSCSVCLKVSPQKVLKYVTLLVFHIKIISFCVAERR